MDLNQLHVRCTGGLTVNLKRSAHGGYQICQKVTSWKCHMRRCKSMMDQIYFNDKVEGPN